MHALTTRLPAGLNAERVSEARLERAERRSQRRAEDLRLLQAHDGGDPDAFRALVERYQRPLFWLARDILLDPHAAADVVQETFLRVHLSLDRFDRTRDFVNWIYRIARNLAIDQLRRNRRRPLSLEGQSLEAARAEAIPHPDRPPLEAVESKERARMVHEILAELPVEYRTALTLRDLHGLSPREIARIADCTYATARWRVHRARSLFRRAWEARQGEAAE